MNNLVKKHISVSNNLNILERHLEFELVTYYVGKHLHSRDTRFRGRIKLWMWADIHRAIDSPLRTIFDRNCKAIGESYRMAQHE